MTIIVKDLNSYVPVQYFCSASMLLIDRELKTISQITNKVGFLAVLERNKILKHLREFFILSGHQYRCLYSNLKVFNYVFYVSAGELDV